MSSEPCKLAARVCTCARLQHEFTCSYKMKFDILDFIIEKKEETIQSAQEQPQSNGYGWPNSATLHVCFRLLIWWFTEV